MTISAVNVKLKFPEFASEDDGFIEMCIEEANRNVDDSWLSGDVNLGLLYLTGHIMMVSIQQRESGTGQIVQSERFGEISMTYRTPEAVSVAELTDYYLTTRYGVRFLELCRLNFPAVAII